MVKYVWFEILPGQVGDRVGDEVVTNPVTMHKTQKNVTKLAWQMRGVLADFYPAKGKNQIGVSPTWPGNTDIL